MLRRAKVIKAGGAVAKPFRIDFKADRRQSEAIALELRAAARTLGLEIEKLVVSSKVSPSGTLRKTQRSRKQKKVVLDRKPRARA